MSNLTNHVDLNLNGIRQELEINPLTSLCTLLHSTLGLKEVKYGCGEGVCGACTVIMDGQPVLSCLKLAIQAHESELYTLSAYDKIESDTFKQVKLLKENLLANHAFQCGYCASGMMASAIYLLEKKKNLTPEEVRQHLSGNICRCSGYVPIIDAIVATSAGQAIQKPKRYSRELENKMNGKTLYPTDKKIDNALIGKVLWSQWPAANILSVNTKKAEQIPGVHTIITHLDIPGKNIGGTSIFFADQQILASKRVNSMSDAVALVVADSEEIAMQALNLIEVSYETRTPVTDVDYALSEDSPRVNAKTKRNVICQFNEVHGDVSEGFKIADRIVEGNYSIEINDHACMEPEGGTAWYEDEVLVISVPTQTPYYARKAVANILNVSPENVRMQAFNGGGSFGKYLVTSVEGYLALMVYKTKRPVRLILNREEALQRGSKRNPYKGRYKLGMKSDGEFTALEADILSDSGPYVSLATALTGVYAVEAAGAYHFPHVNIRVRGLLTNNLITTPMRGFGTQQVSFGIESIVEKAAVESGIDPGLLKIKNFRNVKFDGKRREVPVTDGTLQKTLEFVKAKMDPVTNIPEGWLYGRGFATVHAKYGFPYGFADRFKAKLSLNQEGEFFIESDIPDFGTGVPTGLATLVAEVFNIDRMPIYSQSQNAIQDPTAKLLLRGKPASKFRSSLFYFLEDLQTRVAGQVAIMTAPLSVKNNIRLTKVVSRVINLMAVVMSAIKDRIGFKGVDSYLPRMGGSRSMMMGGHAVIDASKKLKQEILKQVSKEFNVSEDRLEFNDTGIFDRNDSDKSMKWNEIAKLNNFEAVGSYQLPAGRILDPKSGNQVGPVDFMDATHGVDLIIHPVSGEVRILKYVACHDVGKIINEKVLRGQITGGITMGIGQVLKEKIYLKDGKVLNTGLHDYLIPTCLDIPDKIEVHLMESGTGLGPHGSKGIGESGAVTAPPAITNALYHALGKQVTKISVTPEELIDLKTE